LTANYPYTNCPKVKCPGVQIKWSNETPLLTGPHQQKIGENEIFTLLHLTPKPLKMTAPGWG